ncbi:MULTISPECIES: hypothetical protein [unclassified Microbacterium]|uniref:hypothetical protein n=1 Tax=unclassified Microbacterium TaxID=2609290 RepID=UPI003417A4B0
MSHSPHKFERLEPTIFRQHPVVNRPAKRLTLKRGDLFRPHGTDSIGEVFSDSRRNKKTVQFRYRHDPDTLHSMPAHEFTDRFAFQVERRRERTVVVRLAVSTKKFTDAILAGIAPRDAARSAVTISREAA